MKTRSTIVIGAGPAGLTAAYELLEAGRADVTIFDADAQVGGLSKTVVHHGNRIDIGGHRFFSKSDWVMRWWLDKLPIASSADPATLASGDHAFLAYQGMRRALPLTDATRTHADASMLVRNRLSRILFGGKLFAYPLKIDVATAWKLGPVACAMYAVSYIKARAFPVRPEVTLEDFFINRFGRRLYLRFFKTYTEKVWGRACDDISAAWGAQRVKGLSISRAIAHALRQLFSSKNAARETSLIEHFLYPRLGPGQMWETVADRVTAAGASLRMATRVSGLRLVDQRITEVETEDVTSGRRTWRTADQVISTMPIRELVAAIDGAVPPRVREIAGALEYRDFMTVGLLYRKLARTESTAVPGRASVPDNWIYVQEPDVKVGRLQIFNNWSPYLVADPAQTWVGLEFFCAEGDALWSSSDEDMIALAKREMRQIGMADPDDCIDAMVLRMPKAYPGYYGAYEHFDEVRAFLDGIDNLWCIGRNGMHRYNNQDHSMLSAKRAVEAIVAGSSDKSAIWAVNIDDAYHEETDRPADAQGSRLIDDEDEDEVDKATVVHRVPTGGDRTCGCPASGDVKVVILAGGLGTRLSEETVQRPKPMVEIGDRPILWHIMKIYSAHGLNDFVVCLGYKGYVIKEFFANYFLHTSNVTFDLAKNAMEVHQRHAEPWRVTLVDTGDATQTGGRIKRVAEHVDDTFCMTYGDGVGDIDIAGSIAFHRAHGRKATVTAVQPPGRFGALDLVEDRVVDFREKPFGDGAWVNGGFAVLSRDVIATIDGDESFWEHTPLQRLAAEDQLRAWRHTGFWQPMDTLREKGLLQDLWASGRAPWKVWK